jgi:hypothetical protein
VPPVALVVGFLFGDRLRRRLPLTRDLTVQLMRMSLPLILDAGVLITQSDPP